MSSRFPQSPGRHSSEPPENIFSIPMFLSKNWKYLLVAVGVIGTMSYMFGAPPGNDGVRINCDAAMTAGACIDWNVGFFML